MKVKKANALVGLIHRTFSYLDGPLFKKLFTTFIRPHLEYDKVICTPHLKKIYNYFGNCATPSHKFGGWFSSHELLRKAKKSESTIVGLQESSRRYDRDFQHFHSYDNCMLPKNFRPRNSPSRKQEYQLLWKATKEGLRQIFSTSERSKHGMSCKKSYTSSLSTYLKTNWMKRGRIYQ